MSAYENAELTLPSAVIGLRHHIGGFRLRTAIGKPWSIPFSDMASGAANDYPIMITVLMGGNVTVDAPPPEKTKETQPQATVGMASTAAENTPIAEVKP